MTLVLIIKFDGRSKAPVFVNVFCPRLKFSARVAPIMVALPLRLTFNNGLTPLCQHTCRFLAKIKGVFIYAKYANKNSDKVLKTV
jgi:hypothetical protein